MPEHRGIAFRFVIFTGYPRRSQRCEDWLVTSLGVVKSHASSLQQTPWRRAIVYGHQSRRGAVAASALGWLLPAATGESKPQQLGTALAPGGWRFA
jgi:hypothetical protein